MKFLRSKTVQFAFALTGATPFLSMPAMANTPASVGLKCEIFYVGPGQEFSQFVRELKLVSTVEKGGMNHMNHKFDHIETLRRQNQPDLKLWIRGNYFHNGENEFRSYMRTMTSVCEVQPGTKRVKCFDSAYSGDVHAHVVKTGAAHHGKKVQISSNDMLAKDPAKSIDFQVNHRLLTGRDFMEDFDFKNPKHLKIYNEVYHPIVAVSCSVRDDAYGVVSGY